MRKTPVTQTVVSLLLDQTKPIWGLAICRELDLKPGTVYPILRRLELAQWVESAWEDDAAQPTGVRRRLYSVTEFGRNEARNYVVRSGFIANQDPQAIGG